MHLCNQHQCPECKRLRRPYQGFLQCERSPDEDLVACTVSCPPGYDFSTPVFPMYVCGRNTSYLWPHESPDNPRCVLPACARISPAAEALYEFRTTLPVPCPSKEMVEQVKRQINRRAAQMTSAVQCLSTGQCSLEEPLVSGCVPRRGRRAARPAGDRYWGSISIQVALLYRGAGGAIYGTESPEFNETILELSQLQSTIEEQTSSGKIYIELGKERIPIDPNATSTYNKLVCKAGTTQSPDGRYCIECSPGWFYDSSTGLCSLCEEGSYQPWSAQTCCKPCPPGQTTYGRGAVIRLECYDKGMQPPSIPENWEEYRDGHVVNLETALPAILGSLIVLCISSLLIIVLRKRYCKRYNIRDKQRKSERSHQPTCPEEVRLYSKTDL